MAVLMPNSRWNGPLKPATALLAFCAVVGFISGCGAAQFGGGFSIGTACSVLLLSIATFAWFRDDSSRRSYKRSAILNIAFVGLTLVVPYYLLRSRGIKGGTIAIGAAISIYFAYNISAIFGVLLIRFLNA